jgi:hypothetical protein
VPPGWIADFEGRHPNAAAFVAGWLSAQVALNALVWPDRNVFEAMFDHWARTGHLLSLRGAMSTPAEDLVAQAERLRLESIVAYGVAEAQRRKSVAEQENP